MLDETEQYRRGLANDCGHGQTVVLPCTILRYERERLGVASFALKFEPAGGRQSIFLPDRNLRGARSGSTRHEGDAETPSGAHTSMR